MIAAQAAQVPGVRALLVRPAILTDTDQNQQRTAKGVVNPGSVSVQTTPDFRVHTMDYCFRSDGRRYQLSVPAAHDAAHRVRVAVAGGCIGLL